MIIEWSSKQAMNTIEMERRMQEASRGAPGDCIMMRLVMFQPGFGQHA
jgi:hypothetical protein